ncbi:MAG: Bax inhibitor-1/YccA family protein [Chloroflexota bacterium]
MQPNDPNRTSYQGGPNAWNQPAQGTVNPAAAARPVSVPREGFLTGAFVWMFVGLLLSAASAVFVMNNQSALTFVLRNPFIVMMGTFALVFAISIFINKLNPLVSLALFFAYALLNGLWLGVVVLSVTATGVNSQGMPVGGEMSGVVAAFLGAAAIFAAAALYGAVTKRDLTSLGGILFMGLIGLLVMMLVQVFFFAQNNTFNWIIGVVGVVLFTGLTAWDVQRIKSGQMRGLNKDSSSVLGALMLYLDFINLFLMLLRIFGSSR